jgi:hypothetical protein
MDTTCRLCHLTFESPSKKEEHLWSEAHIERLRPVLNPPRMGRLY